MIAAIEDAQGNSARILLDAEGQNKIGATVQDYAGLAIAN
jgi:hypothetical protein